MSGLTHPAAQKYAAHVNAAFVKVLGAFGSGRVWVRAKGTSLWDADGREYLDFLSASGAASLGHNPPKVLDRLREVLADDAAGFAEAGVSVAAGDLAAALAKLAFPLTRVIPSTTRGEAIDSALKLARAATKRRPLVHCRGGFHGTTLGSLSVSGHGRLRDSFEPLLGECYEIPFDDVDALAKVLEERKPAAFVVEAIQVAAGVVVLAADREPLPSPCKLPKAVPRSVEMSRRTMAIQRRTRALKREQANSTVPARAYKKRMSPYQRRSAWAAPRIRRMNRRRR